MYNEKCLDIEKGNLISVATARGSVPWLSQAVA